MVIVLPTHESAILFALCSDTVANLLALLVKIPHIRRAIMRQLIHDRILAYKIQEMAFKTFTCQMMIQHQKMKRLQLSLKQNN